MDEKEHADDSATTLQKLGQEGGDIPSQGDLVSKPMPESTDPPREEEMMQHISSMQGNAPEELNLERNVTGDLGRLPSSPTRPVSQQSDGTSPAAKNMRQIAADKVTSSTKIAVSAAQKVAAKVDTKLKGNKEVDYDTEKWIDCVMKAADKHARDSGYEEANYGGAMSVLKPGGYIYVPKIAEEKDGKLKLKKDWKNATRVFKKEFTKFPTAAVCYTLAQYQWNDLLFRFATMSGARYAEALSDVNVCMSLFMEEHYSRTISFEFRAAYVFLTMVANVLEVVAALSELGTRDNLWLEPVRRRHGYFAYIKASVKRLALRYFRASYIVLNAGYLMRGKDGGSGGCDINQTGKFPVVHRPSYTAAEFDAIRDFQSKILSSFLKDVVLFGMMAYIIRESNGLTPASIIKIVISALKLLALREMYMFIRAVRNHYFSLQAEIDHGEKGAEGALKGLLANPLRRAITCTLWCCRRREKHAKVEPTPPV